MAIDKELLDILACPKCKGDIYLTDEGDGLICDQCKLKYEIKDDIPVMLIDEAIKIDWKYLASAVAAESFIVALRACPLPVRRGLLRV